MDKATKRTLANIKRQNFIRKTLKTISYLAIISGIALYISIGINKTQMIKIVSEIKEEKKNFTAEKTMINPSIKVKYNDEDIYDIKAKKAYHKDENEAFLEDVEAQGKVGFIKAGKLKIQQEGDRLIFSDQPFLILNK